MPPPPRDDPAHDALTDALEVLVLERSSACLLDAAGRFLAVNRAWDRFALENGGAPRCLGDAVVGTAYVSHVEGAAPREQVEHALQRALRGETFGIDSECSSPDRLRVLRTQHVPVRGSDDAVLGVVLVHAVVREGRLTDAHPPSPPDDALYRRRDGLALMCSSCRRIHRAGSLGRWDFVPVYLERPPAPVTHGFCEPCFLQFGAGTARRC